MCDVMEHRCTDVSNLSVTNDWELSMPTELMMHSRHMCLTVIMRSPGGTVMSASEI